MHELGIASRVLEIAVSEAARHDAARVTAVRLRVGVLRGVVPEHMVFLFGEVARGTIAEGARVDIEPEPVSIDCEACGALESASFSFECPSCGRAGVRVSGGDALSVAAVELDV